MIFENYPSPWAPSIMMINHQTAIFLSECMCFDWIVILFWSKNPAIWMSLNFRYSSTSLRHPKWKWKSVTYIICTLANWSGFNRNRKRLGRKRTNFDSRSLWRFSLVLKSLTLTRWFRVRYSLYNFGEFIESYGFLIFTWLLHKLNVRIINKDFGTFMAVN